MPQVRMWWVCQAPWPASAYLLPTYRPRGPDRGSQCGDDAELFYSHVVPGPPPKSSSGANRDNTNTGSAAFPSHRSSPGSPRDSPGGLRLLCKLLHYQIHTAGTL